MEGLIGVHEDSALQGREVVSSGECSAQFPRHRHRSKRR